MARPNLYMRGGKLRILGPLDVLPKPPASLVRKWKLEEEAAKNARKSGTTRRAASTASASKKRG